MAPIDFDTGYPESDSPYAKHMRRIAAHVQEVVSLTRAYSESQADLWRRVPWLALQAAGRMGNKIHAEQFALAFYNGLWRFKGCSGYLGFVDCANGKLVDVDLEALADEDVLTIALRFESLDAEGVVADLNTLVEAGHVSESIARKRQNWRAAVSDRRGIEVMYVRKHAPAWKTKPE